MVEANQEVSPALKQLEQMGRGMRGDSRRRFGRGSGGRSGGFGGGRGFGGGMSNSTSSFGNSTILPMRGAHTSVVSNEAKPSSRKSRSRSRSHHRSRSNSSSSSSRSRSHHRSGGSGRKDDTDVAHRMKRKLGTGDMSMIGYGAAVNHASFDHHPTATSSSSAPAPVPLLPSPAVTPVAGTNGIQYKYNLLDF